MENTNNIIKPENKKSNDFMKLVIGIIVVIISLVALKFLSNALGII
ncbi:MAG TPA: hypothetical protein VLQ91_06490 [Draconibacterium sp.]|nr:hypothetical protein [Draconibacterium sp.]